MTHSAVDHHDEHARSSAIDVPDVERRVHAAVGRALGRFAMLRPGDRLAVGVSGGKDSLALLSALVAHRRRVPFAYDVVAVTIEQGKFKRSIESLRGPIERLGVEWVVREDHDTLALVKGRVEHGCDVCSRHRGGCPSGTSSAKRCRNTLPALAASSRRRRLATRSSWRSRSITPGRSSPFAERRPLSLRSGPARPPPAMSALRAVFVDTGAWVALRYRPRSVP